MIARLGHVITAVLWGNENPNVACELKSSIVCEQVDEDEAMGENEAGGLLRRSE